MSTEIKHLDFFQIKEKIETLQPICYININQASRRCIELDDFQLNIDSFEDNESRIYSFRFLASNNFIDRKLLLNASYDINTCAAGGWLLIPKDNGTVFWIPRMPALRQLDDYGHILKEVKPELKGLDVSVDTFSVTLAHKKDYVLDVVVIEMTSETLVNELSSFRNFELNSVFLWGSHSQYSKPADVFIHFIHGYIYENRTSWPFFYKICSENDAHALFVTLNGLERNTGKKIYKYLKSLLVLSVISRQSDDGGWYHGEWTQNNESHYRLHTSALHLLMDYWSECGDDMTLPSLKKGINFLIENSSRVNNETWFLHDELETNVTRLKTSPFKWTSSNRLGQSSSNMLVLNTHLDTTIAIQRYSQLVNDNEYQDVIASANRASLSILLSQKYTILYRMIDSIIFLTLLPSNKASKLPISLRLLKRIGWKYLSPNLYKIKARFPRLVMPSGFIERALTIKGLADEYLSINMMDLARLLRWNPNERYKEIFDHAMCLEQNTGLREKWLENKNQKYSLGFYAEAMYHMCLIFDDWQYRVALVETLKMMLKNQQGLLPSLLGGNCEAIENTNQTTMPNVFNENLLMLTLSGSKTEIIILNKSLNKEKLLHNQYSKDEDIATLLQEMESYRKNKDFISVSIETEIEPDDWLIFVKVSK